MDPRLMVALRTQENVVREMLRTAEDADALLLALDAVDLLAPVWCVVGYGNALNEVKCYARERAEVLLEEEKDYISRLRKNDKTRGPSERHAGKLLQIIDSL